MNELFSEIAAIANSRRFTAFADGVDLRLADGSELSVKLVSVDRSIRSTGHRFSKYAYVAKITAGDHIGVGYGEAPTKMVALQKSIAEGVERAVYRAVRGTTLGTSNSNGWAAHINAEQAFANAFDELLERDSVLVHWLRQEPFYEVDQNTWPTQVKTWSQEELMTADGFNTLRVLVSSRGYVPTVTAALLNKDGYAVLSHASGTDLEHSLVRALAEACRIAEIAKVQTLSTPDHPNTPEEHAMFYATQEKLPAWMFGSKLNWKSAAANWKSARQKFQPSALNPKFDLIANGPLAVGYASCDAIQGLYFGRVGDAEARGQINFQRLREFGRFSVLNPLPHCVP